MITQWLQEYALLALRIDKIMRSFTELPEPWLQGANRWEVLRHLLREQVLPSDLVKGNM
jgi:hypothetical protein